jgi:hypothetical protein
MIRFVLAFATLFAVPRASLAEEVVPQPAPVVQPQRAREIRIEVPGERSRNNKLLVGGMGAAGVVISALAVYWHLDSRDASNAVGADEFTGEAWTDDKIALVDRAERSKTRATIAYSVGGALLIGAIATWIFTEPKSETAIIRTGRVGVAPVEGGGMVTWSY